MKQSDPTTALDESTSQEPFDEHATTPNPHTLNAIYNFFDEYLK
jgi:hypothetical protein